MTGWAYDKLLCNCFSRAITVPSEIHQRWVDVARCKVLVDSNEVEVDYARIVFLGPDRVANPFDLLKYAHS